MTLTHYLLLVYFTLTICNRHNTNVIMPLLINSPTKCHITISNTNTNTPCSQFHRHLSDHYHLSVLCFHQSGLGLPMSTRNTHKCHTHFSLWQMGRQWRLTASANTLWTEKHTKMFSYLPENPIDSDNIWYMLSWTNLRYCNLNVFQLTWIMLLHYLVKLSVHVL